MKLKIRQVSLLVFLTLVAVVAVSGGNEHPNYELLKIKEYAQKYLLEHEKKIESYNLVDVSFSYTQRVWVLMYESKKLTVGDHFFLKVSDDDDVSVEYQPGL